MLALLARVESHPEEIAHHGVKSYWAREDRCLVGELHFIRFAESRRASAAASDGASREMESRWCGQVQTCRLYARSPERLNVKRALCCKTSESRPPRLAASPRP